MPSPEPIAKEAVARFIKEGFLFLNISTVADTSLRAAFDAGPPFFSQSLEEKMRATLPCDSGYRPTGIEYSQSAAHPDEVESFTASRRIAVEPASLPLTARVLHERMLTAYDLLEPIVETMTAAVASELGIPQSENHWSGAFRQFSFLQMNYSRPAETRADCINDLHEDGCLLTIMSVTADGLEIQGLDGRFRAVSPSDRSLLLIAGEILWLLTGGIVSPIYHRVRPVSSIRERMSLLLFGDLDPRLCAPWISNETNKDVDIGRRVLENSTRYGLAKWKLV